MKKQDNYMDVGKSKEYRARTRSFRGWLRLGRSL